MGLITGGSEGSPTLTKKLIGDKVLQAADRNEHLDRALYLFGSLTSDWRGLYMVLEAAGDANGGESGLIAKNWVTQGQIKSSKATANSYKAIRRAARHGSIRQGVASATITLSEAYEMVRTILGHWAGEITRGIWGQFNRVAGRPLQKRTLPARRWSFMRLCNCSPKYVVSSTLRRVD